ncbi:histidine phosphatase family protein [Bombilactobacillus folatiphilus]|uniref:Histidine phosphatase family protein n=1 Tax=Bombilactobacillus folatiphilus TaxID=2923362 RepID=A0ABY4P8U9_9LACO|nr:histidine phosphatase family protein [Bombilactobacillus folatiphilus]UQS82082.1 histidine phosphatase family protein [Bombilactobacillus folatiphilus]
MLDLYIVRHGQTDTNKTGKMNGAGTDLPLNDQGIQQVKTLKASLDMNQIDALYTSPLQRAVQTAQILSQEQLPLQIDERLREIDYGDWDGQDEHWLQTHYPQVFDAWGYSTEEYTKYSTGESYAHLGQRLLAFEQDLIKNNPHQKVLLVCHGTVGRVLVQRLLGIDHVSQLVEIANAAMVHLVVHEDSGQVDLRYYNRKAPSNLME